MENIDAWAVGIGAGFVASLLLFVVLLALRPRLAISTRISKLLSDDPYPVYGYRIKVVNKSRRSAVDVSVRVFLVQPREIPTERPGEAGIVINMHPAGARREGGYYPGYRKRDKLQHYAQRIRLHPDTIRAWEADESRYLLVRVVARDGVSGFPKAFSQEYRFATEVIEGTFADGRALHIIDYEPRGRAEARQPMIPQAAVQPPPQVVELPKAETRDRHWRGGDR